MGKKSFLEHFDELRTVLLRFLAVLGILFLLSFFSIPYIEAYLYQIVPKLIYLRVYEPILARFAIMAWVSAVLAIPYLLAEIYLYIKDSYRINAAMVLGLNLSYLLSAIASYIYILPKFSNAMLAMANSKIDFLFSTMSYIQFAGSVVLVCALIGSLPFLILVLGAHHCFGTETLKEKRVVVLPLVFIISALITPPDVLSQIFVAALLYMIYELLIILSLVSRRTSTHDPIGDLSQ